MNKKDKLEIIDKNLSKRHINLDPNGYFIIKIDFSEEKIIFFILIQGLAGPIKEEEVLMQ